MLPAHLRRNARRALGILLLAGSPLSAQTYGNSLVARQNIDEFANFLTILSTSFLSASLGGTLSTFSVFGGQALPGALGGSNTGRSLTPFLARLNGGMWSIVGVGTSRSVASGVNTWDFGLTSGSGTIAADLRFGWWTSGAGAVQYSLGGDQAFFTNTQSITSSPTSGQDVTTTVSDQRTYSIQWTVTPPTTTVPEPSTYALMGAGLVAMGALRRRRAQ